VPNIKSSKKRVEVARARTLRNTATKSHLRTTIKKFKEAVASGDQDLAKTSFVKAISTIDKAAKKGIMHKNTAARKKSQLQKLFNTSAS
jgi:small subunit ribosomal protein S20